MQITARAAGGAVQGDNFGFVLLRRGSAVRRIPYAFSVSGSSLTSAAGGGTQESFSPEHARRGRPRKRLWLADFAVLDPRHLRGRPVGERRWQGEGLLARHQEAGRQRGRRRGEAGDEARCVDHGAPSSNQPIHPWFMGSLDENDVLGYAGIPVNVNGRCPTSSTRSEPRVACSCRPAATTSPSTPDAISSPVARSPVATRCARGSTTSGRRPSGSSRRRSRAGGRRSSPRSPMRSRASTRTRSSSFRANHASNLGRRVDLRSGNGHRSVPHSPQRASAHAGDAVHAARGLGLPGREEHQHRVREPASRTRASRESAPRPCRGRRSPGSRPRRASARAARQRLLVVANDNVQISSVGFFDGKREIGPRAARTSPVSTS